MDVPLQWRNSTNAKVVSPSWIMGLRPYADFIIPAPLNLPDLGGWPRPLPRLPPFFGGGGKLKDISSLRLRVLSQDNSHSLFQSGMIGGLQWTRDCPDCCDVDSVGVLLTLPKKHLRSTTTASAGRAYSPLSWPLGAKCHTNGHRTSSSNLVN